MPFHTEAHMGPQNEVAHSIALYECRHTEQLQVGGGRLTRWFSTRRRRFVLDRLISGAGFSCFGSRIYCFSDLASDGYTYVMVIGQSSINIHTYPQDRTVSVWVVTCPGEDDDGSATHRLEMILWGHFGARSVKSGPIGNIPLRRAA